jgi:outer membrane protein assembly factor BamE (lipoprotein component of BamABCDE complex)
MDKKLLICSLLAFLFLFISCASSGNKAIKEENQASISEKIVKGKTTKEEIKAIFGDPVSVGFTDSGKEYWNYVFTKTHKSGAKCKMKQLVIMFDDTGEVVMNYSLHEIISYPFFI